MNNLINRRQMFAGAGIIITSGVGFDLLAQESLKDVADLQPGEFTWHPERQTTGPVAVVVSLPLQRVNVYRKAYALPYRLAPLAGRATRRRPGCLLYSRKIRIIIQALTTTRQCLT